MKMKRGIVFRWLVFRRESFAIAGLFTKRLSGAKSGVNIHTATWQTDEIRIAC
jgi:hypothetical protein